MLSDLLCSIFSSKKEKVFLSIPFSSEVCEFIKSWQLCVLGVQIVMLTFEEPLRGCQDSSLFVCFFNWKKPYKSSRISSIPP